MRNRVLFSGLLAVATTALVALLAGVVPPRPYGTARATPPGTDQPPPAGTTAVYGQYRATPPTLTDKDYHPALLDAQGKIVVNATVTSAAGLAVQGVDANGASATVAPVGVAAIDSASKVRELLADASGRAITAGSVWFADEATTGVVPTASNGSTLVSLCAGSAGKRVFPLELAVRNASTSVFHRVQLVSTTTTTVLYEFDLSAGSTTGGSSVFLSWVGQIRTAVGDGLSFKFTDGTGSSTDVSVSGAVLQR